MHCDTFEIVITSMDTRLNLVSHNAHGKYDTGLYDTSPIFELKLNGVKFHLRFWGNCSLRKINPIFGATFHFNLGEIFH